MFYGRGAGGAPDGQRRPRRPGGRRPQPGRRQPRTRREPAYADLPVLPMGEALTRYHVALDVDDRPGVLAAVAQAFADHDVSHPDRPPGGPRRRRARWCSSPTPRTDAALARDRGASCAELRRRPARGQRDARRRVRTVTSDGDRMAHAAWPGAA